MEVGYALHVPVPGGRSDGAPCHGRQTFGQRRQSHITWCASAACPPHRSAAGRVLSNAGEYESPDSQGDGPGDHLRGGTLLRDEPL